MTELVDRIAQIIEWHVSKMGGPEESDCRNAADDIVRLLADPSKPTEPEQWAADEAARKVDPLTGGTREERLFRYLNHE